MNKHKYVKPNIGFESLALSSELYSGCAFNVNFAEFICPITIPELGNETIFQEYNCDWSNEDIYVCYHVPTASMNVFGS